MKLYAYVNEAEYVYPVQSVDFRLGTVTVDIAQNGEVGETFPIPETALLVGQDATDGRNSFHSLYWQRGYLISLIVKHHKERAWKVRHKEDTEYAKDFFTLGVTTPAGDFSVLCPNSLWDSLDLPTISELPEWDGHQASDIKRLATLR